MPMYLIEREIPGLGDMSPEELVTVSRNSNAVLKEFSGAVQWIQSYVTADKMTCVYLAPNAQLVHEHADRGGFPANRVAEVQHIVSPLTADGAMWSANAVPMSVALPV